MKATWGGRESMTVTAERLRRLDIRIKRVAKLDRLFKMSKFDLIKEYKV